MKGFIKSIGVAYGCILGAIVIIASALAVGTIVFFGIMSLL